MPRLIAVIVLVAIVVYAFIVALRMNPKRTPAGINKWVWVIFTILPPIVGSIIFLVANYMMNAKQRPAGGRQPRGPRPRDRGPIAPDDDPEFLKGLEEELRRAQYDKKLREHEDDTDS
ncbi:PLD nuclease N-terminal domain-containing protein [Flaviflexus equikiangi]|uniref:PLDc_N domain-containing protein n=1 Tax=Flaviflexus equikiangi TaxID=2758573 RepID=A0ABS2TFY3_9ACTO|nr:PLD nuclease N-terminal domain-containing protein [Flaviflexus equikiangi]MBM9433551.1 PLDc_N domain-containing protein [Flaviflexus equikiangi]